MIELEDVCHGKSGVSDLNPEMIFFVISNVLKLLLVSFLKLTIDVICSIILYDTILYDCILR